MLYPILRFIFRFFFRVQVNGDLRVLQLSRVVITPNCTSFLDGVLLALFLPIKPVFVVQSDYVNHWFLRIAKRYVDIAPINRKNPGTIKNIISQVNQGRPVIIFPEGRITVTGSLMKIYPGAAFIAAKSEASVVPIWIDGLKFTLFGRLKGLFRLRFFPRVRLNVSTASLIVMPSIRQGSRRRAIACEQLHQIMMSARIHSCRDVTLFEALLHAAACYGWTKNCIQDNSLVKNCYLSFVQQILALNRLLNKVTSEGENLGVLLPNSTTTAATIFAASVGARVPVMLNPASGVNGLANAIKAATVKNIITSHQFLKSKNLMHLPKQITNVNWLYLEELQQKVTILDRIWVVIHLFYPRAVIVKQSPQSNAVILFTSGSVGVPKGVVHSHSSLLANVEQIRTVTDLTPRDKFMAALPLSQAFGLTTCLLTPLMAGSQVLLYPNPQHYRIIPELIYSQDCTILFSTPTFLSQYTRFAHPYDLARLRYVVSGAEALSENIRQIWLESFGIRILEGYGVTECAPVITINLPMANRWHTVGQILPDIESRLIPVPGIKNGGGLQVKGPNVMTGYLYVDNPTVIQPPKALNEEGREDLGWYDTGDIVSFDKDGFCTILGRVGRFAKIGGEMLPLEMVERLATKAAPLGEHIATARNDVNKGESIVLFTTANNLNSDALMLVAQELGISTLAVPKDIRVIPEMPRLASGKYDFIILRQMAEEPAHLFL